MKTSTCCRNCKKWRDSVVRMNDLLADKKLDVIRLREALEFYAKDDTNAVECGILGSVDDRPATKTLKEVG